MTFTFMREILIQRQLGRLVNGGLQEFVSHIDYLNTQTGQL